MTERFVARATHSTVNCGATNYQYEEIDYKLIHESIGPAYEDFSEFVALLATTLDQDELKEGNP